MSTFSEIISNNKDTIKKAVVNVVLGAVAKLVKSLLEKHQTVLDMVQPTQEVSVIHVPVANPRQVTFIQSPNFSSRNEDTIKAVVLHHTGAMTAKSTLSWFQSKESGVSAHYVIDRNGDIYQMVKEADKAWHCGDSVLHGKTNVNTFSIGIELVGDGVEEFPREQYDALAWVIKMMKLKYNIEDNCIVGHKDIAVPAGRKIDPQPFNWNLFWVLVRQK
jgi:N-acetyl-anhydromuramyl-L-alanine amidase AmpD